MKVKEWIEKLQQWPQEAEVIHDLMSDYHVIEDYQVKVISAEEKKIVLRQGRYIDYRPRDWAEGETPCFVTVVHIDGN